MKINQVLTLGLAIAAVVSATSPLMAQKKSEEPIRVFIFTAPTEGGFVDPEQKQRTDSVEDLKKALDKKGAIQIISEQAAADVTLEVLGRGYEGTGTSTTTTTKGYYGVWNSSTDEDKNPTVHVGLKAGSYVTIITGDALPQQFAHWRLAAGHAASKIEKWINENHDTLIAHRVQK